MRKRNFRRKAAAAASCGGSFDGDDSVYFKKGNGADARAAPPPETLVASAAAPQEAPAAPQIREQIKAGVFPIRFKPEEWMTGDQKRSLAWLLDVIAPSQKLASTVLANFSQVVKEGDVRIHPIVAAWSIRSC